MAGNVDVMALRGFGTVDSVTVVNAMKRRFILPDVLYASYLLYNLESVSLALERDFNVIFDKDGQVKGACRVKTIDKPAMNVKLVGAEMQTGLYELLLNKQSAKAHMVDRHKGEA